MKRQIPAGNRTTLAINCTPAQLRAAQAGITRAHNALQSPGPTNPALSNPVKGDPALADGIAAKRPARRPPLRFVREMRKLGACLRRAELTAPSHTPEKASSGAVGGEPARRDRDGAEKPGYLLRSASVGVRSAERQTGPSLILFAWRRLAPLAVCVCFAQFVSGLFILPLSLNASYISNVPQVSDTCVQILIFFFRRRRCSATVRGPSQFFRSTD